MPIDYSDYNARINGTYSQVWTKTNKCVFCDLREKYIITENEYAVLTVNIFPYINGHMLVIPKRHVEDFLEITVEEWGAMQELAKLAIKLLKKSKLAQKETWVLFRAPKNFGAGKTVPHSHMLILPYKSELVNWNYKDITLSPVELALKLRELYESDFRANK
jgi:diadenosine tetraphosphate (Ap4A) HIT family hydrolase